MTNRPQSMPSVTTKIPTDHGSMYVTICYDNGKPREVRVNVGKAGSCTKAHMEALAVCISIGLQYGIPVEEFEEKLRGIRCQPVGDGDGFIHSPADGVAKALKENAGAEIHVPSVWIEPIVSGPTTTTTNVPEGAETMWLSGGTICPDCETDVLIFEEGCAHCRSCGYSKC